MTASPGMTTNPAWTLIAVLAVLAGLTARADSSRDFESRVRPLLVERCQECHGATLAEAGLRLDSRRALLRGGDAGPVVVPGAPADSRLVAVVRHGADVEMPPTGRLADHEIRALEEWVAAGLPWPGPGGDDDPQPADGAIDMQRRIAEATASHWAFSPPTRHDPPDLDATLPVAIRRDWQSAAIDRFVAAGLSAAGLAPAPPAPPRELVRRLFFDLTGLPPSAAEADRFCADPSDAAYRELVDRLLASRAHAEHWARTWLDLARYADTVGYAGPAGKPLYTVAWTYRDWVVRALHADLPYDRFVTLQLAADRLSPPVPREDLAALGFLTVGREFPNPDDVIDDRIDLVTRGLLGLTAACARCHDHKYEPISTTDYYALHGIFASSEMPDDLPAIGAPPPGPEAEAFTDGLRALRASRTDVETAVQQRATREAVAHAAVYFEEVARPAPRTGDGLPPLLADGYELRQFLIDRLAERTTEAGPSHPILGPFAAVRGLADAEIAARLEPVLGGRTTPADGEPLNPLVRAELIAARPATLRQVAEAYGRLVARVAPAWAGGAEPAPDEPADLAAIRAVLGAEGTPLVVPRTDAMQLAVRAELEKHRTLQFEIAAHVSMAPGGPPRALALVDRPQPKDSHVFLRGNPGRLGDLAPRRMPLVLGGAAVDRTSSGRLDLARCVVDPANPLTARVLVNWVWTHHFGRGLVETAGDLGLRGERPTHPELLDDLARRFIDEGRWSLRWLHREIVTSAAWRQASVVDPDRVARDPDNRLCSRAERRRLDWEAWRDALLAAAGTLDLAAGGGGPGIDPLATAGMHVRSLYARIDRQDVPGIMRAFDIANPDTAVHVRSRTTVPQQSLAVLNGPLVVEAARRVGCRTAREAGDDVDGRIVATWRAILSRDPTDAELALAHRWIVGLEARAEPPEFGPFERLAQAVIATAEFQFID